MNLNKQDLFSQGFIQYATLTMMESNLHLCWVVRMELYSNSTKLKYI